MSSIYHGQLTVSIFGQSHAPAIGVTVDGLPAGEPVDLEELQVFLNRRAPGTGNWSCLLYTSRPARTAGRRFLTVCRPWGCGR